MVCSKWLRRAPVGITTTNLAGDMLRLPYGNWEELSGHTFHEPSVGRFFFSECQDADVIGTGHLFRLADHRSPYWYIRGGPHAALSDVGDPKERQAQLRRLPT
jgi:hypothetical protein